MDLDLVHVHGGGAHGLGHLDAVAGDAGGVGGDEAVQLGLELGHHLQVGAEAAGGQHHALGVDGVALGLDAHGGAVGHQDLSGGGIEDDLHAVVLAGLLEDGDEVGADGDGLALGVHGAVDALDAGAAEGAHVVQVGADGGQPLNGGGGVLGQGLDQVVVVQVLAAHQGVQDEQLHAVKVAGGVGLVGVVLLLNGGHQVGELRIGLGGGGQSLLHAGVLGELVGVLPLGLGGVHTAGGADGVAAHHGGLLQQDHGLAGLSGGDGGGHTGAAGAHDHHVSLQGLLVHGDVGAAGDGSQSGGVHTGGSQSGVDSLNKSGAGDGSAGDGIDLAGLGVHHGLGQALQSHLADGVGLGGLQDLHGINLVGGQGHGNLDGAAEALGLALIGAGGELALGRGSGTAGLGAAVRRTAGAGGQAEDKSQRQEQSAEFLHHSIFSPL